MESESQSIFSRISGSLQNIWSGVKDFFRANTEEMKVVHIQSFEAMNDQFSGFIEEMQKVQFAHAMMVQSMINGFNILLSNTQSTVDSMKKKLQELRSVLLQIKAITAPKDGNDNRSLSDIGRQFGAVAPTSNGVFKPLSGTIRNISSSQKEQTSSNPVTTTTPTQNVNFHIQGTFDSEDKAEALIDKISRRIQLQSLTG